jgi:SNF2 family DNA or RNA helicase
VLICQVQAGGTGLNIQAASIVIFTEPQIKPSLTSQAISRAYRMGQTRNVLVYRLLCENSVDERIMSLLENKQAVFDAFADQSEAANESREIDEHTLGDIIKEEIERINEKHSLRKNK